MPCLRKESTLNDAISRANIRNGTDKSFVDNQILKKKVNMADKLCLNSDIVVNVYSENRPQLVWEMNHITFLKIRHFTNAMGRYLWIPDTKYCGKNGQMLGLDITISDEPGIRLVTIFRKSEHSKLVMMEG